MRSNSVFLWYVGVDNGGGLKRIILLIRIRSCRCHLGGRQLPNYSRKPPLSCNRNPHGIPTEPAARFA